MQYNVRVNYVFNKQDPSAFLVDIGEARLGRCFLHLSSIGLGRGLEQRLNGRHRLVGATDVAAQKVGVHDLVALEYCLRRVAHHAAVKGARLGGKCRDFEVQTLNSKCIK
eukprot:679581_1